jgi:hypothetical protein
MVPVTFQYEDQTEKTWQIPSRFADLTPHQYIRAVAILEKAEAEPQAHWMLLPALTPIPMDEIDRLPDGLRVQLLTQFSFLEDATELPYQCLIPRFQLRDYLCRSYKYHPRRFLRDFSATLHGPGDGLKFLSFAEFMAAELAYEQAQQAGIKTLAGQEKLNQLCGILYRKVDPARQQHEDPRRPFNESLIHYHGTFFRLVEPAVKRAILLNYYGAKSYLPKIYKQVFPASVQATETAKRQPQALTWLNTAIALAARDLSKVQDIKNATLHLVLKVLDDTIAHNQELKAEYDRRR